MDSARKIARKVLSVDPKTVIFHTYHLDTGNSSGLPSECSIYDFKHWADHEASSAETARLKYHEWMPSGIVSRINLLVTEKNGLNNFSQLFLT
jgi:hypothetical protein